MSDGNVQCPRVVNNNNNNDVQRPRVVLPPRVDNNKDNDVQSQRVIWPRAKIHQQKHPQGTSVYRIFEERNRLVEHRGYICDFDKKEGYYKVKYQDGNTEEYEEKEIETMLRPTERNTNILRALAATKHDRTPTEGYTG